MDCRPDWKAMNEEATGIIAEVATGAEGLLLPAEKALAADGFELTEEPCPECQIGLWVREEKVRTGTVAILKCSCCGYEETQKHGKDGEDGKDGKGFTVTTNQDG